jgi:hypothetical protein
MDERGPSTVKASEPIQRGSETSYFKKGKAKMIDVGDGDDLPEL